MQHNEPQTGSELMMQNQMERHENLVCVLPNIEMQKFLIDVLNQTNFPGSLAEFVSQVKKQIRLAKIATT